MSDNRTDAPACSFPTVVGYEILAEERRDRLGVVTAPASCSIAGRWPCG